MIHLIEDEISRILHAGIARYAGDAELVSKVLNIDTPRATRFANVLKTNPPNIRRGYPRHPTEIPCMCIMLAGEEESQSGLGDHNDEPPISILSNDEEIVPLKFEDSIPTLTLSKVPLANVDRIVDIETGTDITDFMVSDYARGKIQIFNIDGLWEDKVLSVEFSHMNTISTSIESKYELNYRVEVWTNNGDFTVELYHMAKAMLLQGRRHLINSGLVKQKLSGTDFQPAPSFFPEFVYRRGVSLSGEALVSVPDIENFDHIISGIVLEPKYVE